MDNQANAFMKMVGDPTVTSTPITNLVYMTDDSGTHYHANSPEVQQ